MNFTICEISSRENNVLVTNAVVVFKNPKYTFWYFEPQICSNPM